MTPRAQEMLGEVAFAIAIGALFPRLGRRRSAKRVALGALVQAALSFGVRQWLVTWTERHARSTALDQPGEAGPI